MTPEYIHASLEVPGFTSSEPEGKIQKMQICSQHGTAWCKSHPHCTSNIHYGTVTQICNV